MRTSLRGWLASVGVTVGTGLSAAHGQTPPAPTPLPPVTRLPALGAPIDAPVPAAPAAPAAKPAAPMPMPAADDKGAEGKPKPKPELVPPMPAEAIPAPTMALFPSTCNTCGDVNPACADPGCAGGMIPGPKDPVWMNNGVMLLWFQPQRQPFPLVAGGPVGGPTTTLLSGTDELGRYLALKIDGGMWVNKDHTIGAGLDGFITEHRSSFATVSGGPGGLSILRPFTDAVTGAPTALIVANPAVAGSAATAVTGRFASLGGHLRRNVVYTCDWQFDLMFGARYYDLDESLQVYQRSVLPAGTPTLPAFPGVAAPAGQAVELRDRAYTRNQFYGGEAGARLEYNHGFFFFAATPKVAFGEVHQITQINGETKLGGQTVQGALLAAGVAPNGNIGRFVTNRFAVATDASLEMGVNISKNTRLAVGYQFYYLNTVARPGQQFDSTINTRVVPVSPAFGSLTGPVAPNVTVDREGFYAHGVSFTMQARY